MTLTFLMTVTHTDGTIVEGTCSGEHFERSLATATRRGYGVEVSPDGSATVTRKIPGKGCHLVAYAPALAREHRTRTTQPSGYLYAADGSRRTNARGGLMHDRGSFWVCSCGKVGAGADREEARRSARRHREEEAAAAQARFEAFAVEARANLAGLVGVA